MFVRRHVLTAVALLAVGIAACTTTSQPEGSPTPSITPAVATAPVATTLRLDGPLATDSGREIVGSGRACGFNQTLLFQTNAMALGDGHVVRVAFSFPAQPSVGGTYSATSPLQQYGHTPVTISEASTATSGGAKTIDATFGEVIVVHADAADGEFYGTIEADFSDGTHLSGVWLCRVGE